MTFKEFSLDEVVDKAIEEMGYIDPTPIQEKAIPIILKGKDLLGCAQTGTGKTAAFALPIINLLLKGSNLSKTKVLILTPTRELAIQIRDNFRSYGKYTNLKCSVIFGGVNQKSQIEVLRKGVDILVATPGRLLDLINQHHVDLRSLEILVLDEADTMLDMGFINDVKKIINHIPNKHQTLMFSATMPKEISVLAESFLINHEIVRVNKESLTVDKINQVLYFVDKKNKALLLVDILKDENIKSALIFTRTKHGANRLGEVLAKNNINVEIIHGNKSQNARVSALKNFKEGKSRILIATDIASRGIDISELSHVINYEMPELAETYVHRIGRTGRAGLSGISISLCDIDEKEHLNDIQKLIKTNIPVVDNHNYPMTVFTLTPKKGNGKQANKQKNNSKKNNSLKGNKKTYNKDYSSKNKNYYHDKKRNNVRNRTRKYN